MNNIKDNLLKSLLLKNKINGKLFDWENWAIPFLIGTYLFFNPFPHTTAIKEICFYLSLSILFFLVVFKKIDFSLKSPLSFSFGLFIFWSFIGLFFAINKENSIHDFYAHLLKYLALYYILINYFQTRKQLIFLTWIVILSVTLFSIGGMINFYVISGNYITERFGFVEMSINYIGFATVFATILSLHQYLNETRAYLRCILIICLSAMTAATFLTQTRGAIFALILSAVVLFIKKRLFISSTMLCIMLIMFAMIPGLINHFNINHILNNERLAAYHLYMKVIKDYPIIGTGFGMQILEDTNFLDAYNVKLSSKFKREVPVASPHNLFIDITLRLGLIGLLLYTYMIFSFFQTGWRTIKYGKDNFIKSWGLCSVASLLSVLVQGMFTNVSFGMQAIYFYTIFAMITILWHLNIKTDIPLNQKPVNI
jgi:putative inorganic carbon (HCO3(-)) transporter